MRSRGFLPGCDEGRTQVVSRCQSGWRMTSREAARELVDDRITASPSDGQRPIGAEIILDVHHEQDPVSRSGRGRWALPPTRTCGMIVGFATAQSQPTQSRSTHDPWSPPALAACCSASMRSPYVWYRSLRSLGHPWRRRRRRPRTHVGREGIGVILLDCLEM